MSYIGNTSTTQAFTPAIDYFSGNASTTAFTLSRPVASVAQVQVVVNNVAQNPASAYTVSSNTITFTSAPSSGTNNIYVYYTSPITQVIAPGQGTVTSSSFGTITDFTTTGNTILGDASTDTLNVGNGGLVKDASGNVGIGTASPSRKFVVSNAGAQGFEFGAGVGAGSGNELLNYNRSTSLYVPSTSYASTHTFYAGTAGGTRAVDIDTSGNLLVAKNATSTTTAGAEIRSADGSFYSTNSATTNATSTYNAYSTGASAYRFYVGMAGTVYATSTVITGISDVRLKENIRDLDEGLDVVMALKPRKFDWKEGKGADIKNARGFIAQEFEQVLPDMIEEWKDPAPEGEEPYKAVNANLIPTLVKAIQEQQALITTLTDRITALEGAK
jgi:hypothetical protein